MIKVTATKLRKNLFNLLTLVDRGETIAVERDGKDVAMIVSLNKISWRDKIRIKPKLLVPADKAFQSLDDIWDEHI